MLAASSVADDLIATETEEQIRLLDHDRFLFKNDTYVSDYIQVMDGDF